MCETTSSLIRKTSMVRSFQLLFLVVLIGCRSSQILYIYALCIAALDLSDTCKSCRSVPVWCAYYVPLWYTCLDIITPSHRFCTHYSSLVQMLRCPTMYLNHNTSPNNYLWYSWFWIYFHLSYSNQYLSHASMDVNYTGSKDIAV